MTTTCYDAVTVTALPATTAVTIGYVDGAVTAGHYTKVRRRFPNARIISCTTTGRTKAMLCDCETGDATPQVAADGVKAGLFRAVYYNLSEEPALTGLLAQDWDRFPADWTGTPHLRPGCVGTQYAHPGGGSPGNYDVSLVTDAWLARLFPPPPPPPIVYHPGPALPTVALGNTGTVVRLAQKACNHLGARPLLAVDGYFGPLTEIAVRAVQVEHGQAPNGVVAAPLWPVLVGVL